jgi:hypothetical protein
MNIISDYWEQIVAVVILIGVLTRMRVDVDVLKEKVKTLFELINRKNK